MRWESNNVVRSRMIGEQSSKTCGGFEQDGTLRVPCLNLFIGPRFTGIMAYIKFVG